ncbi:MAG: PilZ domain-containing protein [Terriglobia bacterium]|jgi:c-di-GMP-binding flagellar brake protein YcgR|nr:PilZ domain-containing protein [Terriglobia bacterium]
MTEGTIPISSAEAEQAPMIEKRRYPRYRIDVAVKVKVKTSSGIASYCYGRGGDISEGGMAIEVAHELSRGNLIRLSVTLPHCERAIECDAVVRHRNQFHYGLEFRELAEKDRMLLMRACQAMGVVQ